MFSLSETKTESGWHYHNSILAKIEGSLDRKIVKEKSDFTDGHIFFISLKRDEWVPTHVRWWDRGYLQLFTFNYTKKLEVKDWLYYHSLFDYNSKVGYVLSKKGAKLIADEGYDYVHFTGDELDEGFIVNPAQQVTNILTTPLKNKVKYILEQASNSLAKS